MEPNQVLRAAAIAVATVAYVARLVTVGNGTVDVFGYAANPFALFLLAVVVLALPETIDRLPFGPSKS